MNAPLRLVAKNSLECTCFTPNGVTEDLYLKGEAEAEILGVAKWPGIEQCKRPRFEGLYRIIRPGRTLIIIMPPLVPNMVTYTFFHEAGDVCPIHRVPPVEMQVSRRADNWLHLFNLDIPLAELDSQLYPDPVKQDVYGRVSAKGELVTSMTKKRGYEKFCFEICGVFYAEGIGGFQAVLDAWEATHPTPH